ncbi:sulfotransferase family protein [Desmospora profundinema]|uniref:Sulfotransferase n=1 Tax=Desmospora profundinema TaxID=1571184 RepID=A0ABU1IKR2_9BACL|nr:hypothetical protein [Desmospora profundinema]MDR6225276.1 hypothetical protein [Desmospora profundinema]
MAHIKPKAIIILGMHRSGTSTITRAINILGADIGNRSELLPPGKSNPKGFWEHLGILRVHQRILRSFSRGWASPSPMPPRWWEDTRIRPLTAELTNLVKRNFSKKPLWVFKDPRTCLLIPLWKNILKRCNMDPCYLIIVRNPLDVAASLKKRNNISLQRSLDLWSLYTLSALKETENAKRVIVRYDRFLNHWKTSLKKAAKELEIPWPKNHSKLRRSMNNFIEPGLQHNKSSFQKLKAKGIPPFVIDTYRLCLEGEKSPELLKSPRFSTRVKELYSQFLKSK